MRFSEDTDGIMPYAFNFWMKVYSLAVTVPFVCQTVLLAVDRCDTIFYSRP